MEHIPTQAQATSEGSKVPDKAAVLEREVEKLLHEQEVLIAVISSSEPSKRVALEVEEGVLAEKIRQKMKQLEILVDPQEFMEREEIAKRFEFDYVSKRRHSGAREAIKVVSHERFLIMPDGEVRGPYMNILQHDRGKYEYAMKGRDAVTENITYDVIDVSAGKSEQVTAHGIVPFDSTRFLKQRLVPTSSQLSLVRTDLMKAEDVFAGREVPVPAADSREGNFSDDIREIHKNALRLVKDGKTYIAFRDGALFGPLNDYEETASAARADGSIDVEVVEKGAWCRIYPNGNASPVYRRFSQYSSTGSAAVARMDNRGEITNFGIRNERDGTKGVYQAEPKVLANGNYLIHSKDVPEDKQVPDTPEKSQYEVNTAGEILSGPWTRLGNTEYFDVLRVDAGPQKGEQYIQWKNGFKYGPVAWVDDSSLSLMADSLLVKKMGKNGKLETYFINDTGEHGPFTASGPERERQIAYAHKGSELYLIFGSGKELGPVEKTATAHMPGYLNVRLKGKVGWYIASTGALLGPLPEPMAVIDMFAGQGYVLKLVATGEYYLLTSSSKLYGPYKEYTGNRDDCLIMSKDGMLTYLDFDGNERFVSKRKSS